MIKYDKMEATIPVEKPSISMAHCSIVGVPWPISGNPEAHLQTKRNGHDEFRKAHILQEFLEMSGGYKVVPHS